MSHKLLILCAISSALTFTGCAKRLVFATQTSLGLDVSGTAQVPNKVSFSHNRYEAAIVPRKTNGEAHSVYGGLNADINFFDGSTIQQTFATGKAAELATGSSDMPGKLPETSNKNTDPLIFMTGTTFGLHLTAGETELAPSLLMGYRRSEATVIPVPDPAQEVRPVYADILINTKNRATQGNPSNGAQSITTEFPSGSGVRIKQSFATGAAAINLAADSGVQEKLSKAAGTAANALARLREKSAGLVREVALEVNRLSEAQLNNGGQAMVTAGLIRETELPSFSQASSFDKARLLRECVLRRTTESEIRKVEEYLVLLRKIQ